MVRGAGGVLTAAEALPGLLPEVASSLPVAAAAVKEPLTVLGVLLVVGALVSGLARRSFLSLTAMFVVAGFLVGEGGLEVLEFDPRSGFVEVLAVVSLILLLFRDGLEVEAEMLQKAWHLPLLKLALAMPITAALVAFVTVALTDLSWTEAFLLGALVAPTDPVLSSSVVTNPRVPRLVRHSLNLESGLNDGLALTAVLAFSAALSGGRASSCGGSSCCRTSRLDCSRGSSLASRARG